MTSRTKKTIAFTTLLGFILLATGCGMFHKSPEERAEWITYKIAKKMDLNETQKTKLNQLKDQILLSRKTLKGDKKKHHEQLLTMLDSPVLEQEKLSLMIDEIVFAAQKEKPALISALGDFYDSLSDEQRKKLKEKMERHHAKKHHHWN